MYFFDPKKEFALNFLNSLITSEEYKPFLHFDDLSFGFFDVQFITKSKGLSIVGLKQETRTRKSFSSQWFTSQVRKIFTQISDYLLLNDPLQEVCRKGLKMVQDFQKQYTQKFRKKKAEAGLEKKVATKRSVTFTSQLQMAFYLKNCDYDEELIRKIGQVCQIVRQDESEIILDLSVSNIWSSIIEKFKEDSISR